MCCPSFLQIQFLHFCRCTFYKQSVSYFYRFLQAALTVMGDPWVTFTVSLLPLSNTFVCFQCSQIFVFIKHMMLRVSLSCLFEYFPPLYILCFILFADFYIWITCLPPVSWFFLLQFLVLFSISVFIKTESYNNITLTSIQYCNITIYCIYDISYMIIDNMIMMLFLRRSPWMPYCRTEQQKFLLWRFFLSSFPSLLISNNLFLDLKQRANVKPLQLG